MARVLIIDDDPMVTRLLQEHLSSEGYEVTAVSQAEQGFALALETPPDIILLDVCLPDATGFQMCGRFRADPVTQAIPIIMMTGSARWPNQQAIGKNMGANEYLLKPFDIIQVGERVHSLLGDKRPAQVRRFATTVAEPVSPEIPELPPFVISTGDDVAPPPLEQTPSPAAPIETPPASILFEATPAPAVISLPSQNNNTSVSAQVEDQRFFDFSAEILVLVSRLPGTRAGRHVADQLLRTGTSVGARFLESQTTMSKSDSREAIQAALKDLRETGYWLMLIRNAGLLEASSIKDLETKCHDLVEPLSQLQFPDVAKNKL